MKTFACLLLVGLLAPRVLAEPENVPEKFLEIYAESTGKTILRPTVFPDVKIAGEYRWTNKQEAVSVIEKTFGKAGYEFVPVGDKFVEILHTRARTNAFFMTQLSRFQSPTTTDKNTVVPAGAVNFRNAPIAQVAAYYADLRGRKLSDLQNCPMVSVTFRSQQDMASAEIIFALNVTMVLNGVVPIDNEDGSVSVVPIHEAPPVKSRAKAP